MLFPRKSPAFSIQIRKNLPFLAVFILLCLVFAACDSATSSSISPSAAFTVTFNANGATGGSVSTSMMVVRLGSTITLPGQGTLVKSGAAFGGWNTNAAGTGTNYSAGELYTVTGDVTLYANWGTGSATAYTVTFNANSATRGTAPPAMTASSGSIITLPGQGMLERTNFTFGGWNTSAAGIGTNYNAGSSYTVTGNITLYARWFAPDTYYTVSFNGNSATGGTEPPAMTAIAGSDITLPGQGTLEKNGAIFGGWNTTASGIGVNYNAGSSFTVAGNTSLYAKWGPIPVSGIEGVPATAIAGTALPLIGTVLPENATNKTIVWSVKDAGGTGATISGGLLNTTGGGTVTVTARIAYGTDQVTAYTQDFAITVLQNVLGDRFEYYWVDSHDSLVTTSGGETTVAVGRTLVITALSTGYIVKQWHLNGVDTGQRGNSYSFSSATTGNYTVGLFVEKDGKLYNTTIVITVELRIVVIDMYDSGGNGWDGNGALRINVNGVQKAADIKVQTTAANNNPSGQRYTNTYTFTVATGDFVQLDWVSGTNQGENSFIAYYADMPPIPSFAESDQTAWIGTNALVYRLRNTMNSIANNDPLGSFSVPDSETVPVITINTQPAAATSVMEGIITGNLSVSAGVTQGAEISYQWYRSNSSSGTGITVLSGETSTDFSIPVTLTAGRYYYFCEARAKGAVSVRSGLATVMVMVTGEANLTDGTWSSGSISSPNSEQWFKFTATAATQYIHVSFGTLTNLNVQLYDSSLNEVGTAANLTGSTRYVSRPVTNGQIYYIKVTPFNSGGSGTYFLTFNTSTTAPSTSRSVTIDMFDSWGDGWNGNGALRIVVNGVQVATNVKVQITASQNNPSGQRNTNTYTFTVTMGDVVQIYWVEGTSQGENSFIVYYTSAPPSPAFTSSNNSTWNGTNALVLWRWGTMNITNGSLLGSFTVQ